MADRERHVYLAKLAWRAGRFQEMAEHMQAVGRLQQELSREERNLLSVAFKSFVDFRRTSLRTITRIANAERVKAREPQAQYAAEYGARIAAELLRICHDIAGLLGSVLIPRATTAEQRAFYLLVKADHHRYAAEFSEGAVRAAESRDADAAYREALEMAKSNLVAPHPIRLSVVLNYSVFRYEILREPDEAYRMAIEAFQSAIQELSNVAEESRSDSNVQLKLLQENLLRWSVPYSGGAEMPPEQE